ncbi:hypothetical protein [Streptomyces sp. NPDC021969]|uniref:hypothetical protein n=1 Tax=unclassified Streptomyces TaxID=2593676 RepID=UPI0033E69CAA
MALVLLGAAGFATDPVVVGEVVRVAGAGRALPMAPATSASQAGPPLAGTALAPLALVPLGLPADTHRKAAAGGPGEQAGQDLAVGHPADAHRVDPAPWPSARPR